jgi:hypothetical protein
MLIGEISSPGLVNDKSLIEQIEELHAFPLEAMIQVVGTTDIFLN